MNNFKVSVVICTHNPRLRYLERVLDGLRRQTLAHTDWELLLIDNASSERFAESVDILWHPFSRHVREEELGLTPARLRGIAEAKAELLIFVDDDNVLEPNYISHAVDIYDQYEFLGAWGGTISPEFEVPPSPAVQPYLHRLAIRAFSEVHWSNIPGDSLSEPCGAGLCIRRSVCNEYLKASQNQGYRKLLGRRGSELTSAEDTDLIYCSATIGLGWGNFPQLQMLHLIPAERLTQNYHLKLWHGMMKSKTLMDLHRGTISLKETPAWRMLIRWLLLMFTKGRFVADMYRVGRRGQIEAKKLFERLNRDKV